jgi:DNA-directed RNA polymerase subunit beta
MSKIQKAQNLTPSGRINFGKINNQFDFPNLLDIQVKSFKDFFQLETTPDNRQNEGLFRVFAENFPITDARNIFLLEFLDYFVDPPRYTIEECIERGLTYSVPLKAKLRLSCNDEEHIDFQTIVQDVFLGNIPYMTEKGTFIINGSERVSCFSITQVARCVFWNELPSKWNKNILCKSNSF